MSRLIDAMAQAQLHIRTLYFFIVVLIMLNVFLWYGWETAPRDLRISIPPDLRAGAIVRPDEFQAAQVYAFASLYQLALNRWEEDGETDFRKRIDELQPYLTPAYRDQLVETMNNKSARGELEGRTRYAITADAYKEYENTYVRSVDRDTWVVEYEMEIVEEVAGLEAKRVTIHYPLSIKRINVDPAKNIFGLALNGIAPGEEERRVDK